MKFRGSIPLCDEGCIASGYRRLGSLPIPQAIFHSSITMKVVVYCMVKTGIFTRKSFLTINGILELEVVGHIICPKEYQLRAGIFFICFKFSLTKVKTYSIIYM